MKALVRNAPAAAGPAGTGAPGKLAAAPTRVAGMTIEAGRAEPGGSHLIYEGTGGQLVVKPDRGTVVLIFRMTGSAQISEVNVSSAGGVLQGVNVSTIAGSRDRDSSWVDVRYCSAGPASPDIACRFVPRTVDWVRLVLKVAPNRDLALQAVSIK